MEQLLNVIQHMKEQEIVHKNIKNEMKEENHAYKYKMFHRDPLSCFYL